MLDFAGFTEGITFNRVITKTRLRGLFSRGEYIRIIRSGVYAELEHCADVIEEVCNASEQPKQIRIILPSILNTDIVTRAREAQRSPQLVLSNLSIWHETLAKLAKTLAPKHILEVRTTMEPHRYHAIFSESEGMLGIPWHTEASITTSSFFIGHESASVIAKLHKDFEVFFEACTPYKIGDDERLRAETAAQRIDDVILLNFGRSHMRVLEILQYVDRAFPLTDGSGVTKDHIHAKFGTDRGDANKKLHEMELAGLLRRAGGGYAKDHCCGRLITLYGKHLVEKYKDFRSTT